MHLSVFNQYGHRITTATGNSETSNVVRMDRYGDTATTNKILIDVPQPFFEGKGCRTLVNVWMNTNRPQSYDTTKQRID